MLHKRPSLQSTLFFRYVTDFSLSLFRQTKLISSLQVALRFNFRISRFLRQIEFTKLKLICLLSFASRPISLLSDFLLLEIDRKSLCYFGKYFHSENLRRKAFSSSVSKSFFACRKTAGDPERSRWLHLDRSGSQSEHEIGFILTAHGASHIINRGYYTVARRYEFYVRVAETTSNE